MTKAVFLDRDGVINPAPDEHGYVNTPGDFKVLLGVHSATWFAAQAGYAVIIVTNQAGVALGHLTHGMLARIHIRMMRMIVGAGGWIDDVYTCTHHQDDGCDCRKPAPGMILQAARDWTLDLSQCVMFGDMETDMQAAEAAGIRGVKITDDYQLVDAMTDFLEAP